MDYYSNQMSKLIEELSCLPGIGAKSAARLAFHLIHMPVDDVKRLASTMVEARENIKYCKECYTLTDQELCPICSNSNRDHQTIMVVENTRDLAAYEKTGKYNGVYHVLHGAISPMLGIGPEDIKLKELIGRLQGTTDVAFTVLDVLGYLDEIPVCTGYEINGEVTTEFPVTSLLEKAKPVLTKLPGWKCDIRGIKKYEELPENCRKYIEFIEGQIGYPITMVSNGPGRDDIIYRESSLNK